MSSPPAPLVLAAGACPLPDYELQALLGRGGFGEVWRALAPGGFEIALKFVRLEGPPGDVERRALETIKGLRHAHLLPVFGTWQRDGWLIVAMELADRTLMDRLQQCRAAGQSGIPQDELLGYLRDAARGLDFLAEPRTDADGKVTFLQHRDVKPQNLLLVSSTVKVADFGLIKVLKHTSTQASARMTVAYAPPELIRNRLSRWSDQYSLAVSYCVLRGGRGPFAGNAVQQMYGHLHGTPDLSMLPEDERPAVARALEKEPARRWPSCLAFVEALAALRRPARDTAASSPPPPPAAPEAAPARELPGTLDWPSEETDSPTRPPAKPEPDAVQRPPRRALPRTVWRGGAGLVLITAVLLATPWLVPNWGGNKSEKAAEQPEPTPSVTPPPRVETNPEQRVEPKPVPALRLVTAPGLTLTAGESQTLKVQVERTNCPGPVTLRLEGLPQGVTADDARVEADATDGQLSLVAAPSASAAQRTVRVVAEAGGVRGGAELQLTVTARPVPDLTQRENALGMKFVRLPKGTFYMGWDGKDKPGKKTQIKEDFEIAIHTVTQGQWQALMGDNPSKFSRGGEYAERVKDVKDDDLKRFPVENVSWAMAQEFIAKLNEREKGSGFLYRLPTEAEWEYACRGGATSEEECSYHFYFAKPTNDLSSEQANFDGIYPDGNAPKGKWLGRPTTVDDPRYPPNQLGLHHMHGNVWQWCQDLYEEGGSARVIRGGCWGSSGSGCRAAARYGRAPSARYSDLGFRLARVPVR